MPIYLIPSFLIYIYIAAITPGPANLSSLSTALRYGKRATIKQWQGSLIGFTIVSLTTVFLVWAIGFALTDYLQYLSWFGFAYITWLAFSILVSEDNTEDSRHARSSFWTGFTIQITNAKAYVMCITALSTYVLPYEQSLWGLLKVGLFLPLTGPMMTLVWGYVGTKFRSLLDTHTNLIKLMLFYALFASAVSLVM